MTAISRENTGLDSPNGWSFLPRGNRVEDGLDLCLDHLTAQCDFGMDPEFRVHVLCEVRFRLHQVFYYWLRLTPF